MIYKQLPVDSQRTPLQEFPTPYKANARYNGENATNSSVMSFADATTIIEVSAVNSAAVIRWVPASETAAVSPFASVISAAGATANFDNTIAKDTVRRFAIPKETNNTASIVGAGVQYGLYRRVAVKSVGIGSVMTAEY